MRQFAGVGFWGKLLDCFYCLSAWVSAPLAYVIGESWPERVLLWPALSAGAILFDRASNNALKVSPALFIEDPAQGKDHVMLRQKAGTTAPGNSISSDHSTDQAN